ncbi:hypothetical protein FNV43_RR02091 [Rhamnella rubrinervis]|uniref:Disease resistance R13L4/SHOC-2-like LRR domain-containing protein n=1 Tax=Rhamnella rubrinervis TaxID=2594499 RepID=A0A8K0MTJ2_9ROSA|nr:hypothetical protein FNV43_RR02091 [Rhamnella rubrinervis]
MKFWKKEKDCCSWDGVTCNTKTGKVVALDLSNSWLQGPLYSNSSLFKLHGLRRINLSFNNFSFSTIPSEFSQLSRLTHLNLSYSMFSGHIPSEISFLTHLVSLSLSSFLNYDASSLLHLGRVDFANLIQNMTNLRHLRLCQVDILSSVPESLANLSFLTTLSLAGCNLHGKFPENVFPLQKLEAINVPCNYHLTGFLPEFQPSNSLREVNLDYTNFSGELPITIGNLNSLTQLALRECNFVGSPPFSIWNLSQLTYLDLSSNHFSGHVLPSTLGNLSKLTILLLESCQLSGELPSSLGNLTQLESLSLYNNSFSGQIPSFLGNLTKLKDLYLFVNSFSGQIPTSFGKLSELSILNLADNNLDGVIPSCLFTLPSLKKLFLASNQFSGPLKIENISSTQLETLNLNANKLEGRIPWMMFKLANLTHVGLENNNLSGTVEFSNFCKLSKLQFLFLSSNSLTTTTASTASELPKFRTLFLSSCNIGEFPEFLKTQDQLKALSLSWNKIESEIPNWFWALGKSLEFIDLTGNKLHGSFTFPPLFTSISYFFISQNNLTGIIPPSLRKWTGLEVLDMSKNHFSGTIPRWLGSSLEILNLQGNNFNGSIPLEIFTYGSMHNTLRVLDLSHNQFQGRVPQSLINCNKLQVLNLGHNQIYDTFPFWLQSLPELQVLVLRSNKFFGPIWHPIKYFGFANLGTIDISFNHFDGSLPSEYFRNWDYMSKALDGNKSDMIYFGHYEEMSNYVVRYPYSMSVMNKGSEMELRKTLKIFMSIDISNNKFDGEIPSNIGKLHSLIMLNLSSNNFSGIIPSSFGNLSELESLDLSRNKLSGRIPQQLANLTFLEYLNLSHNTLEGPVPQGTQLDTFSYSSFEGNPGLCGSQLPKKCENTDTPIPFLRKDDEEESENGFTWKVVAMGYGCGFVVATVIGHVTLSRRSSWLWRSFVGRYFYRLW